MFLIFDIKYLTLIQQLYESVYHVYFICLFSHWQVVVALVWILVPMSLEEAPGEDHPPPELPLLMSLLRCKYS